MLNMEVYKDYLLLGAKFEKLEMLANAKKMYKYYLQKVADIDYDNILKFFYGNANIEADNYEETINKAYLIEKLKKLYSKIKDYRFNWIDPENSKEYSDEILINFFNWVASDKVLSNSDLKMIDDMIKVLDNNVGFNIVFAVNTSYSLVYQNSSLSLFETISKLRNHEIRINGKELR